ncbi:WHG domain-containing protein [Streptomyces longwoodensis]|uniref:TetR/AcrR family transcriptional regulator n=1 Tax=Streptomyces longwoodensis TaxID=68231 RepID=UPI00224E9B8F|nr:TetR/AcrR family transcriptional regulator [Streptomyces longwoodensis]MCX5000477.1 WHG domain-containing protein [Streptomyces longwoodensis]WTI49167.1 WHG domain-containing protein [Streptomyces longwoodensis]WUC61868.1 WHG domain-containing protein [Streptomyces longwoodensis]WUC75438.1 WHG domain-containing protein [Streptomyces longwoodensis]
MPRVGLDSAAVVAAGADLADEVGLARLTMGLLAERLGVRTPSLYKHVSGQEDLLRRIAALAAVQAADAVGTAVQGLAGRDALAAALHAFRTFVINHPGRYAATTGMEPTGPDDPMTLATQRLFDVFRAVLRGYGLAESDMDHALRMFRSLCHGFATLEAASAFRWSTDIDKSFEWLIAFTDRGLRTM